MWASKGREHLKEPCDPGTCHYDIRSRPDPLALLKAWRNYRAQNPYEDHYDWWNDETEIIEKLSTNPEAMLKELKEKGVWKDG